MDADADTVVFEAPAHFRFYKSGRIERLHRPPILPAGDDEATGVTSKDVVLDADTGLSVRLYLPKLQEPSTKLLVLVYFHGRSFLIQSADSSTPTSRSRLVGDLCAATAMESGADEVVFDCDDYRIYRSGKMDRLCRPAREVEAKAKDMAMIWEFACPGAVGGADDPRMNPMAPGAPGMENLRCERMLVCAGEKDWLAARDRAYYAAVTTSAWRGSVSRGGVAWIESEGEGHVFFLKKPDCARAKELMARVVAFIAGA
uniref:Uncharacterized protein n=1 Tax=Aegilops tauschii TaxID=37682 RepID=M8CID6_AEGTA